MKREIGTVSDGTQDRDTDIMKHRNSSMVGEKMIWFGPAGNSKSFYEQGYKHSWQMPQWLREQGLNAYEYQCSKGILLKEETAARIGEECRENNIRLSIHAPYYINLSSTEKKKRERSIEYILDTLRIAKAGRKRIIMHPGMFRPQDTRRDAKDTLSALAEVRAEKLIISPSARKYWESTVNWGTSSGC